MVNDIWAKEGCLEVWDARNELNKFTIILLLRIYVKFLVLVIYEVQLVYHNHALMVHFELSPFILSPQILNPQILSLQILHSYRNIHHKNHNRA